MIASSRRMVEELGITQRLLETDVFAGLIELLEGDAVAAERTPARARTRACADHGLGIDAARAAALLGRALLAQGRAAEAEALSHESEALAGDDLQAAITWRRVRAEALARAASTPPPSTSPAPPSTSPPPPMRSSTTPTPACALAAALRAAGRGDEADAEEARAIELWEAKGATLLAERARGGAPAVWAGGSPIGSTARGAARRRVRENAATANAARLGAVIAARDRRSALDRVRRGRGGHRPSGWYHLRPGGVAAQLALAHAHGACAVPSRAAGHPRRFARALPSVDFGQSQRPRARSTSAPGRPRASF